MKILVTGATGFLGRHLCKKLKENKHDIFALSSKNADLTNQNVLAQFNDISFDRIFHLACWMQPGDFYLRHLGEQWIINQKINTNTLEWWFNHQRQAKMVSIGTCMCYPEGKELVEDNYLEGSPVKDSYVYAMTKRMLHVGKQAFNNQYCLNYLTLVTSALYGPDYHKGRKNQHFIYDLIKKILEFKYYKKDIVLWGDGTQERDLIFVLDFIDAMLNLDKFVNNDIVNVSSGYGYSIRQFAEIICEMVGVRGKNIKYNTSKYTGAKSKILNTTKLDKLLPERKKTSLEEGLKLTIEWMQKQYFNF